MSSYGLVMASVTEFVVTICVFLFIGRWFDGRSGGAGGNKFMVIGAAVGFVLGFVRLFMRLRGVMNDDSKS